ncbi:MAG TPA: ABC transporter substrate-binding protein [Gaiellaceae bacterium]|nr:ABC transporter substrate-binding protein [Gaiellaceae bacterium]
MRRALCLLVLVLIPAAFARSSADPGIGGDSILIGGTAPLSGEAAAAGAVSRGAKAYLDYVNARGGVFGRKIVYKVRDDGYDPARTVQDVRELVRQDRVFALFNMFGTSTNLAVRDFLNRSGVPQLFVGSGATTWGRDAKRYPWTIGYFPSYRTEGIVLARQVLKTKPDARIAVLYQDDDYGTDLLAGFRRGLAARPRQLAKAVGYDPTGANVDSQVAELRATKADTFMVFAFGKFATQAMIQAAGLGWRPQVYVNAVASSTALMRRADLTGGRAVAEGAVSVVFFKDPSDPSWANDPGIGLMQAVIRKYAGATDVRNGYYVAGMASAFTLVDVLKKAGKILTRAGIMAAARSLNEANNPFVLPGIVVKTSTADGFPMQQVALARWSGGRWNIFTGPLTISG